MPRVVGHAGWRFALLMSLFSSHAFAEESRLSVRGSAAIGTMVSRDQLGRLGFDRFGVLGSVALGYGVIRWLDLQLGLTGGGFLSSKHRAGGLAAATLGALLHGTGKGLVPYLSVGAGPGVTGSLTRPFLGAAVGVDIPIAGGFAMGPCAGYSQLVQWNDAGSSTDARIILAGVALRYRPTKPDAPRASRIERVRVVERVRTERPDPAPITESPELMEILERALPTPTTQVELLAPVLFAFDSDVLEPVGVAMLHEVAQQLVRRADIELVSIQGYADERGRTEYNRELSERRARRVLEWLVEHDVEADRLQIDAEGASHFVETGKSEAAHEQNRRVVFRVVRMARP